jgi:hypothetical protein
MPAALRWVRRIFRHLAPAQGGDLAVGEAHALGFAQQVD